MCDCCLCSERALWGDEAARWGVWRGGWGSDVLRSEPVLSEDPAPLLVHLLVLGVLLRLVFLAGFWGVVSSWRSSAAGSSAGIESRDDADGFSSDSSALAVVSERVEALAWGCCCGDRRRDGDEGRGPAAAVGALFGGGVLDEGGGWRLGVAVNMSTLSIDCLCPAVLA